MRGLIRQGLGPGKEMGEGECRIGEGGGEGVLG
jgi:hypothetical protein